MGFTSGFVRAMENWRRLTEAAEGAVLDNVAATSPWLAPALPAAMSYYNMQGYLEFEPWLAVIGAICIEFLGLASVHTTFQLWQYNDTRRESDQKAPVVWAAMAGSAYLVIVILVNAVLESAAVQTWTAQHAASIAAKALLSLLSVVAAFVLALRAQHRRRVQVIEEDKAARREAAELGKLRKLVPLVGELKQELEQARQKAAQAGKLETALGRLETEVGQLQTMLGQAETERDALKQRWDTLPVPYQAAVAYHLGAGTVRDIEETFGVSRSAVSRRSKELFGSNGVSE